MLAHHAPTLLPSIEEEDQVYNGPPVCHMLVCDHQPLG